MVLDSITRSASIPSVPKDLGKKKRANRSAKLKQCKLDARREQWLSQVKNRGCKEELSGPRASPPTPCKNERKNALENLEMKRAGEEGNENGSMHHEFDSDSPSNSPTCSSDLGGTDVGTNFSGSSSSSSSSSGGCGSGFITEEEEEGDDNCLDDWEAVADALVANDETKQENQKNIPCLESQSSSEHHSIVQMDSSSNNLVAPTVDHVKQECQRAAPPRLTSGNSRAWRPDDEFRPQSLPNLLKQRSFPDAGRHYRQGGLSWARASVVNAPSSCPICYEDLDITDTSFLPCFCGFRLCLFCHKRILEEDGRCPGCRKPYEHITVKAEASVYGGSLTFGLARSCSMITRS
uniref:RING-type domain-containing protein n=1 Tax=Rhizophora mucronata TaxID=61149 RepID=A0A2P2KQM1_RHIMU